uniref:Uncharacterized protein n=1 Tax=Physcomitrium patens TaxID=3218 RepID=A0A7I4CJQ6_PHYPA
MVPDGQNRGRTHPVGIKLRHGHTFERELVSNSGAAPICCSGSRRGMIDCRYSIANTSSRLNQFRIIVIANYRVCCWIAVRNLANS